MNIFKLDEAPEVAAMFHCDRHIVKMPIEYAQMLSTAIRLKHGEPGQLLLPDPFRPDHKILTDYPHVLRCNGEDGKVPMMYLVSHVNHPCCQWARLSKTNWLWLKLLALSVGREYQQTYGRIHASTELTLRLEAPELKLNHQTEVAVVVPDDCRMSTAVESYRELYRTHKRDILSYSRREVPFWLN